MLFVVTARFNRRYIVITLDLISDVVVKPLRMIVVHRNAGRKLWRFVPAFWTLNDWRVF